MAGNAGDGKRRVIVAERTTRRTTALEDMRRRIVEGEFAPGARLPTRKELIEYYDTSPVTIQRVFDSLIAEGFVRARGRAGTFVSEAPPHTSHYIIFFPPERTQGTPNSMLWHVISEVAGKLSRNLKRTLSIYDWSDAAQDAEKNLNFLNEVLESRVAGVIFPSDPSYFRELPIMHMPDLPRIALGTQPYEGRVAAIRLVGDYFEKACDYFQSRGRKRIAFLSLPGMGLNAGIREHFNATLAARGMECPDIWRHMIDRDGAVGAQNLTRVLFSGATGERPDGLLIADDNLVTYATRGLEATGLSVPDDVDVIAHTNFPLTPESPIPIKRLGYDIEAVLLKCVEYIDECREGKNPADIINVAPIFEDEL